MTPEVYTAAQVDERARALGVIDPLVSKRRTEAEDAIKGYEPLWQECLAFLDGDQYVERNATSGALDRVETKDGSLAKPRWRSRTTRNRFTTAIVSEASVVTSRVPGYEAIPINGDPGPQAAAVLTERVLASLHFTLGMPRKAYLAAQRAATTGAAFAYPCWDAFAGPPVAEVDGQTIAHEGELKLEILGQDEVLWEPGVDFENAAYYIIRKAQPVARVLARRDYTGPKGLPANATTAPHQTQMSAKRVDLCFVYSYFEKPTKAFPKGRTLQFVGDQEIAPPADYPRASGKPPLHELPWIPRDHQDRAMGIGEQLLDVQRTYNRTVNQIIAWKNLCLVPQIFAPENSLQSAVTDEPGAVIRYRPIGGLKPEWRQMPDVPQTLFETLDRCIADITEIVGQRSLPTGVASGNAVAAINDWDAARRDVVIKSLAAWYSSLGLHMIEIVRERYTEKRLLVLQGQFGIDLIEGFLGSQTEGVLSVLVQPAAVEPRTRAAQEAKIMSFADKGWIDPHQAMAALNGGTADALIDRYELDIAKQHREVVQMISVGANEPTMMFRKFGGKPPDPVPAVGAQDGHAVHMDVIDQWMLTRDFETQPPAVQEAAGLHRAMHEQALQQKQQQAMDQQNAMAQSVGAANAGGPAAQASPGAAKPMPTPASLGAQAAGAQGLPNG